MRAKITSRHAAPTEGPSETYTRSSPRRSAESRIPSREVVSEAGDAPQPFLPVIQMDITARQLCSPTTTTCSGTWPRAEACSFSPSPDRFLASHKRQLSGRHNLTVSSPTRFALLPVVEKRLETADLTQRA